MGPHTYRGLDESSKFTTELSLREVAEQICELNHGEHRLLSHLIDVRREQRAAQIAAYRARGDDDVADYAERRGDPLADGIEALLKDGLY